MSSNETQFIDGLIVKAPNENAPDYVKAKLSIKREELIGWLQSQDGDWINVEVKESRGGKWYAAVDTWKPEAGGGCARGGAPQRDELRGNNPPRDALGRDQTPDFADDDIPF